MRRGMAPMAMARRTMKMAPSIGVISRRVGKKIMAWNIGLEAKQATRPAALRPGSRKRLLRLPDHHLLEGHLGAVAAEAAQAQKFVDLRQRLQAVEHLGDDDVDRVADHFLKALHGAREGAVRAAGRTVDVSRTDDVLRFHDR